LNNKKEIRDFLFRGLMFESEASLFQSAGIKIGAEVDANEQKSHLEALAPYSVKLRNRSLEMARLYSILFCFENDIRDYIRETLTENVGIDWWGKLPNKIKSQAESRQASALKDSWLEGEKMDLLGFVDFGILGSIIVEKWEHFGNIIPSQHWLKQRMDELEKTRNFIAHNRMLLPSEFQRIYMYIADWNRITGH
jgi:hypothetical protein